jgi:hypothetical protein
VVLEVHWVVQVVLVALPLALLLLQVEPLVLPVAQVQTQQLLVFSPLLVLRVVGVDQRTLEVVAVLDHLVNPEVLVVLVMAHKVVEVVEVLVISVRVGLAVMAVLLPVKVMVVPHQQVLMEQVVVVLVKIVQPLELLVLAQMV